jgi:hypothetical protein
MSKLSREDLEEILERELPGYRLAPSREETDAPSAMPAVDEATPDLEALRQKFLGADASEAAEQPSRTSAGSEDSVEPEDSIIAVEPKEATDPWDQSRRPKVVIVSGKDRRVIGTQG